MQEFLLKTLIKQLFKRIIMNLLFFDCETNGLPKNYSASYEEVESWPRVISLAWLLVDTEQNIINSQHHLIKPNGWTIPAEEFWTKNGFSTERSLAEGIDIDPVLEAFVFDKHNADVLVAHNLNFDHRIVWAEIIRSGRKPKSGMEKICTMMKSTKHCNIPSPKGYGAPKWPTLNELHNVLFKRSFEGAHDALADVTACKDCFFELLRLNVISLPVIANQ
jgi:DNA polymerase-3 subunit epsilon